MDKLLVIAAPIVERLLIWSGETHLQVCATVNQQHESENYVMTPFGIVVFWQRGGLFPSCTLFGVKLFISLVGHPFGDR